MTMKDNETQIRILEPTLVETRTIETLDAEMDLTTDLHNFEYEDHEIMALTARFMELSIHDPENDGIQEFSERQSRFGIGNSLEYEVFLLCERFQNLSLDDPEMDEIHDLTKRLANLSLEDSIQPSDQEVDSSLGMETDENIPETDEIYDLTKRLANLSLEDSIQLSDQEVDSGLDMETDENTAEIEVDIEEDQTYDYFENDSMNVDELAQVAKPPAANSTSSYFTQKWNLEEKKEDIFDKPAPPTDFVGIWAHNDCSESTDDSATEPPSVFSKTVSDQGHRLSIQEQKGVPLTEPILPPDFLDIWVHEDTLESPTEHSLSTNPTLFYHSESNIQEREEVPSANSNSPSDFLDNRVHDDNTKIIEVTPTKQLSVSTNFLGQLKSSNVQEQKKVIPTNSILPPDFSEILINKDISKKTEPVPSEYQLPASDEAKDFASKYTDLNSLMISPSKQLKPARDSPDLTPKWNFPDSLPITPVSNTSPDYKTLKNVPKTKEINATTSDPPPDFLEIWVHNEDTETTDFKPSEESPSASSRSYDYREPLAGRKRKEFPETPIIPPTDSAFWKLTDDCEIPANTLFSPSSQIPSTMSSTLESTRTWPSSDSAALPHGTIGQLPQNTFWNRSKPSKFTQSDQNRELMEACRKSIRKAEIRDNVVNEDSDEEY